MAPPQTRPRPDYLPLAPEDPTVLAKKQVSENMTAGMDWANSIIKPGPDGTFKHLSDDYRGQMDDYLAMLKERTGGMDSKEMLAMREQGLAGMDQQLAQNMRRAGQIAGNAGVRGGAAAGLQMGALNQTAAQRANLERQMIIDNIAQKNQAFAAYGGALGGASDRALGIGQFNIGQDTKAALTPAQLAMQYGGLIDSTASGIKADRSAAENTKLAGEIYKGVLGGGVAAPTATSAPNSFQSVVSAAGTGGMKLDGVQMGPNTVSEEEAFNSLPEAVKQGMTLDEMKGSPAGMQQLSQSAFNLSWGGADKVPKEAKKAYDIKYSGFTEEQADAEASRSCIVATEAIRQGRVSASWLPVAQEYYRQRMPRDDIKVYWAWAASIVAAMRKSPLVSRAVASVLPGTLTAMAITLGKAKRAPLHGRFFFGMYRLLNYLFRPIVIRRNGKQLSKAAADRLFKDRTLFRFLRGR
jgi:hypothetical protein